MIDSLNQYVTCNLRRNSRPFIGSMFCVMSFGPVPPSVFGFQFTANAVIRADVEKRPAGAAKIRVNVLFQKLGNVIVKPVAD